MLLNASPVYKAAFNICKHLSNIMGRMKCGRGVETRELKVSLSHCLQSMARQKIKYASWRSLAATTEYCLMLSVIKISFGVLLFYQQNLKTSYFLPKFFTSSLCEEEHLRNTSIHLWSHGNQLKELNWNIMASETNQLNKQGCDVMDIPNIFHFEDILSPIMKIQAFFASLFQADMELKVGNPLAVSNPLFERFHRVRFINSLQTMKHKELAEVSSSFLAQKFI